MDTKGKHCRKNIEKLSNCLSILFFGWTIPIFWKGARRALQVTDLYVPNKSDESEDLGDRLEREWMNELMKTNQEFTVGSDGKKKWTKEPNLLRAITRVFGVPYLMQGLLLLFGAAVLHIMEPILQGWIVSYFNPDENIMTRNQCLLYAGWLMIVNLGIIFIIHHTNLRLQRIGMRVRVACCSMIYRKVLRLDQTTVNTTASGRIANLISNDVARFDIVAECLHYIWITPIQVMLIGYLIWQSVGVAALIGLGALTVQTILFQGYLSYLGAQLRSSIASKTDERVQLMSELISGIQVVKMYSWEKPIGLIISKVRDIELKVISYASYLRGICLSFIVISDKVTLYLTLISFVLMENSLTAETTFVVMGLTNVLNLSCNVLLPFAIIFTGEAFVSLKRITEFLLLDEIKFPGKTQFIANAIMQDVENEPPPVQALKCGVSIEMSNVVANWVHGHLPPTLCQVSMKIESRSLCAIVGSVGSGKSSLLHLMLGELSVGAGALSLSLGENSKTKIHNRNIRVSYASQDPWIFFGSIRDNITFGQQYDKERYEEVTSVCALLEDFKQLPHGDMTFVGERGASLSGGQRARVSLARAVYRDAELYLLDDPLSAVDPRVSRHLFEKCITGFLKGKTRILVTHQLQYLPQVDSVVVLNRGTVKFQGTYEELITSDKHILKYKNFDKLENSEIVKRITVTADEGDSKSGKSEVHGSSEDTSEEEMATGKLSNEVYRNYFLAGGNWWSLIFLTAALIIGQLSASGTDYWVTYWTNEEMLRVSLQSNQSDADHMKKFNETIGNRQDINFTEPQSWLDENGLIRRNIGINIYTICVFTCILFNLLSGLLFVRLCMCASRSIHESMFTNLLQSTMQFFNTNPSGRILNRFSKDMGAMDEILPRTMLEFFQILMTALGVLLLIFIVNFWMILPAFVVGGVFYVIRIYYLKTAQSINRLEGISKYKWICVVIVFIFIAKSPVFSHISSTLDGLVTIRSRGPAAERFLRKEFDLHQNRHTGAWYLEISTANAFGFILDLISWFFIGCVCFSLILMDNGDTSGGYVGLAISQALILTGMVQFGIKQSAQMVSHMTSIERLLQYTKLPKEGSLTSENPPPADWPSKGALDFRNVTMKYANHKPPVLKNLNVNIRPGWKVGIVGRTGAGKSSLISALFRLAESDFEGEIILDEVNTKSIGLHELRPRISIIPQEPILFTATLRHNLDPFEQYSDAEIWNSLREVELGDVIPSLYFKVTGGGTNFSVGQRQLICLARAILKNNRVIVLDEATANVDRPTDVLIQSTIRRRFADCTVLTIAHQLDTVMDSDRVLVMEEGRIVEFDHPYLLLKNPDGHFSKMLQQTGKSSMENLNRIAESAYRRDLDFGEKSNKIIASGDGQ